MAKFKAGDKRPENAGRKPGTPNKKTLILSEIFDSFDFCPAEKVVKLIIDDNADLMDKEKADIYIKLMEFKFPKRKAVEHSGEIKQDIGLDGVLAKVIKDVQNGKS
jgi:hypothetical protein